MNRSFISVAVLAGAVAFGFAGSAEAKTKSKRYQGSHYSYREVPAKVIVAPGDSVALINRSYPLAANPPSLRQTYNLRGLKMQESRN